ncbi:hypothetical protein Hamer_G023044 [Homarus americanus]|uniref:Uncharacterized protein n=1 Tax=Homarus americanus TaxID=6706 RepID=A0A8J5N713_HOMAM|nr:hypothetical protein Hamer_G023044 [Homarus americanus]
MLGSAAHYTTNVNVMLQLGSPQPEASGGAVLLRRRDVVVVGQGVVATVPPPPPAPCPHARVVAEVLMMSERSPLDGAVGATMCSLRRYLRLKPFWQMGHLKLLGAVCSLSWRRQVPV